MSLLDHPEAQALLADAAVTPGQVRGCRDRLAAFLPRYLPEGWAADPDRRQKTRAPPDVTFPESWRIAADLLERCRTDLPHAWVTGDDGRGRPAAFRGGLRRHGARAVRDVPRDTSGRDLGCRRPRRARAGRGRERGVPSRRADAWAARQPEGRSTGPG